MSYQRQQSRRQSIPNAVRPFYDLYQAIKTIGKIILLIGLGVATFIAAVQAIVRPFQQTYKTFQNIFKVFGLFYKRPVRRQRVVDTDGAEERPVAGHNAADCVKRRYL